MKLGFVTGAFRDRPLAEALDALAAEGVRTVEIPVGGYHQRTHCDPARLLADASALAGFRDLLVRRGVEVSALGIHGNPFYGAGQGDTSYDRELSDACQLAERIGVSRLTLLAGLPPGMPGDRGPNWITATWPPVLSEMYRWQWEEVLIPYWAAAGRVAQGHGVRLCFEMQGSDCVYNPRTMLRLRAAVGPVVGCNFDPSHLFFQGIDAIEAVRTLGEAIYHVHLKDAQPDPAIVRVNGSLDRSPDPTDPARAWAHRSVGQGHGEGFWRELIAMLRQVGYDDVLSIEHEDRTMSPEEGAHRAVEFVRRVAEV